MSTYEEATAYIESIPRFGGQSGPASTRKWLDLMGAPDEGMNIIHVAGTNGKGSVCCYLDRILRCAGYRTGMFISPHLVTHRERISLDGEWISEETFAALFDRVLSLVRSRRGAEGLPHPTYFEFLFLMAMLYYGERGPDYVILETGIGGRLDATNAVADKRACVITRIGLDHMKQLGGTVAEIAAEKAGIIRPGTPCISLATPGEAFAVIQAKAEEAGAPLYAVSGREAEEPLPGIRLTSPAPYQYANARLAALSARVLGIPEDAAAEGLCTAHWTGRMDEIMPDVFIDGAHNEDGIGAFLSAVRAVLVARGYGESGGEVRLLFSAVSDKRVREMVRMIGRSGLFTKIVLAPLSGSRALSSGDLAGIFASENVEVHKIFRSVPEAWRSILSEKNDRGPVFAAGSLYLVGEILREMQGSLH